ncbi:MAG: signal peptidase I [Candidatus Helarchaeota archaeon]
MSEKGLSNTWKSIIIIAIIVGSVIGSYFVIRILWNTITPITVVQGTSMEPTLYQGDLLFVKKPRNLGDIEVGFHSNRTGDILIYYSPIRKELIVHRVVDMKLENGTWYFATWGDNNPSRDDNMLYPGNWLSEEYVRGIMIGRIPWIGNIGIFLRDSGLGIFLIIIILGYLLISTIFEPKVEDAEDKAENIEDEEGLVELFHF